MLARVRTSWTRGHFAVDAKGRPCNPNSEAAVKWCALGAMHREGLGMIKRQKLCEAAEEHIQCISLDELNDRVGQDAVVNVLERVLAEL